MKKNLLVLVMGGTIDGEWGRGKDGVVMRGESHIRGFIRDVVRFPTDFDVRVIALLNSSEINDHMRLAAAKMIKETPHTKILITHGTDTVCATAELIAAELRGLDKRIVCTGSFFPPGYLFGDAGFNLGYALGALMTRVTPGVYLAMHGELFPAGAVRLDEAHGVFVQKTGWDVPGFPCPVL